ncbi:MAG: DUF1223 domain-containing protein [Ferruginibacter sp.]
MKNNIVRSGAGLLILVTVILLSSGLINTHPKLPVKAAGKGFAVIELFTSEGCSSCPAADAEVEKVAASNPGNVYVLGFHVDYWNRLGWTDEFSNPAYSTRQREYADHFKLDGVYTPQVIVNGGEQMVGSDDSRLQQSVASGIQNKTNRPIQLSASATAGNTVLLTYQVEAPPSNTVTNIALVQVAAQTQVKRGENEGRTLRHINIVRDFKTVGNGQNGSVSFNLPKGIAAKECNVLVYVQHRQTREIIAVTAVSVK